MSSPEGATFSTVTLLWEWKRSEGGKGKNAGVLLGQVSMRKWKKERNKGKMNIEKMNVLGSVCCHPICGI